MHQIHHFSFNKERFWNAKLNIPVFFRNYTNVGNVDNVGRSGNFMFQFKFYFYVLILTNQFFLSITIKVVVRNASFMLLVI